MNNKLLHVVLLTLVTLLLWTMISLEIGQWSGKVLFICGFILYGYDIIMTKLLGHATYKPLDNKDW